MVFAFLALVLEGEGTLMRLLTTLVAESVVELLRFARRFIQFANGFRRECRSIECELIVPKRRAESNVLP